MTAGGVYSHQQRLFNLDVGLHVSGTLYVYVTLVRIVEKYSVGGKKAQNIYADQVCP